MTEYRPLPPYYYSLPVVGLTAIFTGMVLALQSYTGFARFSAEAAIANVVVLSMTRELGPVLAGLMVGGPRRRRDGRRNRHHARHRADRRADHAVDQPVQIPGRRRALIAGIVTLPLLVLVADIIGVFGGYLVGVYKLGFNDAAYLRNTLDFLQFQDVFSGPGEGRGVRLHHHPDGLLPRLHIPRAARRASARRPPTPWSRPRS